MNFNKFSVFCDGGLCNRLNSLVVALIVAKQLDVELVVYWPSNNWCEANFEEVFDLDEFKLIHSIKVLNLDQRQVQLQNNDCCLVAHERQTFEVELSFNPNTYFNWKQLIERIRRNLRYRNVIYFNSTIPFSVPTQSLSKAVASLPWNKLCIENASRWMMCENIIIENYWAIHLRGTDYRHAENYFHRWYWVASCLPGEVLLCTDDPVIRSEFFSRVSKVVSRQEENLPEKYDQNQAWTDVIKDDQGRLFEFNVRRGVKAIEGAIVDLIILSKGKIIPTSRSTFLGFAMLMKWNDLSLGNKIWIKVIQLRNLIKQLKRVVTASRSY
jgi:hypothetical protein